MNLGVWAHPFSTLKDSSDVEADAGRWLERLRDSGITLLASFVIDSQGEHFFDSSILGPAKQDFLSALVYASANVGVQLHPTISVGELFLKKGTDIGRGRYMPVDIHGRAEELPAWAENWFCPAWEEGRELSAGLIADLVDRYEVGGVNLDYLRYPNASMSAAYPCGCPDCRRERKRWFGKELPDAEEWANPGFLRQELNMRTGFVRDLVRRIKAPVREKEKSLSLCARARYLEDAIAEGQDWVEFARSGLVDMVWPMSYNDCFERFVQFVDSHVSLLKDSGALYWAGVGRSSDFGTIDTELMIRQVQYAMSEGADGVMIFHDGALDEEDYSALRSLSVRGTDGRGSIRGFSGNSEDFLIGNPGVLKRINRVRVMSRLWRAGSKNRVGLSEETGLDAKTITNVCNSLLDDNLIRIGGLVSTKRRGRPAQEIVINGKAAFSIGVDIGATQSTAVLLNLEGRVIFRRREVFDTAQTGKVLTRVAGAFISEMLEHLGERGRKKLEGIGICVPGLIDRSEGVILQVANIPELDGFHVKQHFEELFSAGVFLEDSSRSQAIGEVWHGNWKRPADFVVLDLGYGIGMGMVHDGIIHDGKHGASGELGHTAIFGNERRCSCGLTGCLETVASGRALEEVAARLDLRSYGIETVGAKGLYEAALAGDEAATEALERAGEYIGLATVNVLQIVDPEYVILNGGLVHAGDLLVKAIRKAVREHTPRWNPLPWKIEVSELGDDAAALGAAILPLRRYYEVDNIRFPPVPNDAFRQER